MRKINAQTASKQFKIFIQLSHSDDMDKQEFIDFMIMLMKKEDLCETISDEEVLRMGYHEIFSIFDYNQNERLDAEEIANCLALMCGGSINEKIFAAFNLFDVNNSMTLSFDELNRFIKCVFQIFDQINSKNSPTGIWADINIAKLTLATTQKCFDDNFVVKGKGEINYTQFMQWMTGQSILAPD